MTHPDFQPRTPDFTPPVWTQIAKEAKWQSNYMQYAIQKYLQVDKLSAMLISEHSCSTGYAIVLRHGINNFLKEHGFNIENVTYLCEEGEYSPLYSNVEYADGKFESCYLAASICATDGANKVVVHLEESYQSTYKVKVYTSENQDLPASKFLEKFLQYCKEHNFLIGKKLDPLCNFIHFEKPYTWDDIIMDASLKSDINKNLSSLISNRALYRKNNLKVKRGIIFSGVPGSGKSTIGKVLCNTIDWTFMWVSPKHLESAKDIKAIIELCKDLSPTVLFLEDIDLYGTSRESNRNPSLLGELMNQLDGIQEITDIITIATTNQPDVLEKALLDRPGRFDKVIHFDNPKEPERLRMLECFTGNLTVTDREKVFSVLSKKLTEGLTGAQIREVVNLAVIHAIDQGSVVDEVIILKKEHFIESLNTVKNKDFSSGMGFHLGKEDDLAELYGEVGPAARFSSDMRP